MKLLHLLPLLPSLVTIATTTSLPSPPILTELSNFDKRAASCSNSPTKRSCWSGFYNINTDYEQSWPDTGKTQSYTLNVVNTTLSLDGISRQVLAVNGQIPGPTITANWGDTISVTVVNKMQDNGTSMHWHGFRQLNTNDNDGVNGVTECPIAPGDSKTYTFKATFYGTSWYHSHFSAQYGDGVFGPIVINGPASANYDVDLGPVTVNEWYYQTAYQEDYAAERKGPPTADNYLLNGMNANLVNGEGTRFQVKFKQGKKYLLRFINTSVDNHFKLHIDGHTFQVISSDFVPITPYTTDWLNIGIGQRYNVVVTASATVGNYFMRAVCQTSCGKNLNSGINGTAHGIVHYASAGKGLPISSPTPYVDGCVDEPTSSLTPVITKAVPSSNFISQVSTLPVALNRVDVGGENLVRWSLNGVSLDLDWENPTLLQLASGNASFSTVQDVLQLPTPNAWVYFLIQNAFFVPHPMHLHGHDFYLLGQGNGTFDSTMISQLNFDTPTRRDTAMLISSGWTAIAFITDNPGAWPMHCHIAWHVGEGLGLQFLERASDIPSKFPMSQLKQTCKKWTAYENAVPAYNKTDSGLKVRRAAQHGHAHLHGKRLS